MLIIPVSIRQQQMNARLLTNQSSVSRLSRTRRRDGPPPVYHMLESSGTEISDTDGEAETSMSEPEYTETEPISPPPPYAP